jgi:hypothetical protein
MPLARIADNILYFAHIPKTGGSSVETYLERKGPVALRFQRRLGWSKTTVQHMEAFVHTRFVPAAFYDASFAVLRDPVSRMLSEYRYRLERKEVTRPFHEWARIAFDRVKETERLFDNHIRPQADFLSPGMILFKLEEGLDPVYDWIDEFTGTEPADRAIWEKKSASSKIDVPEDLEAEIKAYYKADYAILAKMTENGRALGPTA